MNLSKDNEIENQVIVGTMESKWSSIIETVNLIKPSPIYNIVYYDTLDCTIPLIARDYQIKACLDANEYNFNDKKPFIYNSDGIKFELYPINKYKTMFILIRKNKTFGYLKMDQKKYIKLPQNMVVKLGQDYLEDIYYDFANDCLSRCLDMDGILNRDIDDYFCKGDN